MVLSSIRFAWMDQAYRVCLSSEFNANARVPMHWACEAKHIHLAEYFEQRDIIIALRTFTYLYVRTFRIHNVRYNAVRLVRNFFGIKQENWIWFLFKHLYVRNIAINVSGLRDHMFTVYSN